MAEAAIKTFFEDFEDDDGNGWDVVDGQVRELPAERRAIYAACPIEEVAPIKDAGDDVKVMSVVCKGKDDEDEVREFVGVLNGDEFEVVQCPCGISCEEVAPSGFIEYKMEAPCDQWKLAPVSRFFSQASSGSAHK